MEYTFPVARSAYYTDYNMELLRIRDEPTGFCEKIIKNRIFRQDQTKMVK